MWAHVQLNYVYIIIEISNHKIYLRLTDSYRFQKSGPSLLDTTFRSAHILTQNLLCEQKLKIYRNETLQQSHSGII